MALMNMKDQEATLLDAYLNVDKGQETAEALMTKASSSQENFITRFYDSLLSKSSDISKQDLPPISTQPAIQVDPAEIEEFMQIYNNATMQQMYDNDMGGLGSDAPDPLGNMGVPPARLVPVDDLGLDNPEPLFKLYDEIQNENIKKEELPDILGSMLGAGLRRRDSSFVGGEYETAGLLSWLLGGDKKEEVEVPGTAYLMDKPKMPLAPSKETSPETDITPPISDGLMSRVRNKLDGKDGDLAASFQSYVTPFNVTEEELYNFAKQTFPNNNLEAGALVATIEAESAGGNDMLENTNYTKEAALKKAYQGTFKTARKKEVEKIFKDPKLTYVDSKGNTRMTMEGQVKFLNIYYADKYRGEGYKLGNTEEGDGFRFRGRGPIQLTGRAAYKRIGDMIGVDLVQNPHLLVTDKDVALRATKAFIEYKKEEQNIKTIDSARDLYRIIGHSDDKKRTKQKARWKRAQEIERQIMRETSPRPKLRPPNFNPTLPTE